jgi:hypothetical protein
VVQYLRAVIVVANGTIIPLTYCRSTDLYEDLPQA